MRTLRSPENHPTFRTPRPWSLGHRHLLSLSFIHILLSPPSPVSRHISDPSRRLCQCGVLSNRSTLDINSRFRLGNERSRFTISASPFTVFRQYWHCLAACGQVWPAVALTRPADLGPGQHEHNGSLGSLGSLSQPHCAVCIAVGVSPSASTRHTQTVTCSDYTHWVYHVVSEYMPLRWLRYSRPGHYKDVLRLSFHRPWESIVISMEMNYNHDDQDALAMVSWAEKCSLYGIDVLDMNGTTIREAR